MFGPDRHGGGPVPQVVKKRSDTTSKKAEPDLATAKDVAAYEVPTTSSARFCKEAGTFCEFAQRV